MYYNDARGILCYTMGLQRKMNDDSDYPRLNNSELL